MAHFQNQSLIPELTLSTRSAAFIFFKLELQTSCCTPANLTRLRGTPRLGVLQQRPLVAGPGRANMSAQTGPDAAGMQSAAI